MAKTKQEKDAIIDFNISTNFKENVKFKTTEAGALSVSVTHFDANKASDYANNFMEEIKSLVESEMRPPKA